MYSGLKKDLDNTSYIKMRECCVCNLRGTKELFKKWYDFFIESDKRGDDIGILWP